MSHVAAPDLDAAKAKFDQLLDKKKTTGQDREFAEALKRLPERNSLIVMIDLPSLFGSLIEQVGELGGAPVPAAVPPAKPSYLGLAVVAELTSLEIAIWLPASTIKHFMEMFDGFPGLGVIALSR